MHHTFAILAHGCSPFLADCVTSVLQQTRSSSEVFLATSTPCPWIRSVAEKNGLRVLVNPVQAGIASDWNFALCSANTAWITLAHQDDLYAADYVELLGGAMKQHPAALIGFSDYSEWSPAGPRETNLNILVKRSLCRWAFGSANAISNPARKRRLLSWGNPICCPSVILNRSRLPEFRFAPGYESNLDWEAWARLAEMNGDFLYVRQRLVTKRIHPSSETSSLIKTRRRHLEDRKMFERFHSRPVAATIAGIYRHSYRSNAT